ncbi:hypothetical protein BD779DRAFT_147596 [Infundibulicybe gibba]|nr:hypothetical protein BD779DRAFT_147596 [Infundibulicybe gibba]
MDHDLQISQMIMLLAKILEQSPVSIEILPGSVEDWPIPITSYYFPFLYVDQNLGVPKKLLFKLYLTADHVLSKSGPSYSSLQLIASTNVIMLANPANHRALNIRKLLILDGLLAPSKELVFTQLLLEGSKVAAKESVIWHHRRWVLQQVYPPDGSLLNMVRNQTPEPQDGWARIVVPPETIRKEAEIIKTACGIYPRNYHAWTHWRHIMDIVYRSFFASEDQAYASIMIDEYEGLRRWVESHVSDYSAMYQLYCHHKSTYQLLADARQPRSAFVKVPRDLEEHAFNLVASYPTHEALWMYLGLVSDLLSPERKQELCTRVRALEYQGHYSQGYQKRFCCRSLSVPDMFGVVARESIIIDFGLSVLSDKTLGMRHVIISSDVFPPPCVNV